MKVTSPSLQSFKFFYLNIDFKVFIWTIIQKYLHWMSNFGCRFISKWLCSKKFCSFKMLIVFFIGCKWDSMNHTHLLLGQLSEKKLIWKFFKIFNFFFKFFYVIMSRFMLKNSKYMKFSKVLNSIYKSF